MQLMWEVHKDLYPKLPHLGYKNCCINADIEIKQSITSYSKTPGRWEKGLSSVSNLF